MVAETSQSVGGGRLNTPELTILYVPIGSVTVDPKNPRVHSPKQIQQIAHSIQAFGYNVPILIDRQGRIVAGTGRYEACKQLGMTEIPVIQLDHLSEHQLEAFRLTDNKLTENSKWNDRLVAESLKLLSEVKLDFGIGVTGFKLGEIDFRIQSLSLDVNAEDLDPESVSGPSVSKPGDLWILGDHHVLNGNAAQREDYARLMRGSKAKLVIADPPYNVKIDGHVSGLGAVKHREFPMASGEMSETEYVEWLESIWQPMVENVLPGTVIYAFNDWRHLIEAQTTLEAAGCELLNLCVWVKDNGGMGSLYRSQHELIFVAKVKGAPHRNNIKLGSNGRYRTNVWEYPGANSFSRATDEGNLAVLHPTVKPVDLIADAILDCSARGDIVLDPFLGSGSTVIACEKTGRGCYGIELDPLYVDTIVRRWQRYTGKEALHAESDRSFNEIATEVTHG